MPSAGNQSLKRTTCRSLRIEVHHLRIELLGEGDNLRNIKLVRRALETLPNAQVFEVERVRGHAVLIRQSRLADFDVPIFGFSRSGLCGAFMAAVIATITLFTLFANPAYNKGVIGAAVWFLLGIVYYAVRGRHQLVLSPEEESAFRERHEKPPV